MPGCSANGKTNRSSHLHQARTPVFGLWRSSFDTDRSIISEKRPERLDRSCISNHPQFRLAHEGAAINLMFRQKL
jgi:hypothetical protein